ncbi:porin [Burkholderia sp. L27(2015)]|uniref:porin n=1 Tax=Burkholderia sp. L27(2015) TaxID=1641858 RepID=UPI00131D6B5E|nr:porin [Burkholderia sp. L27(2015)]
MKKIALAGTIAGLLSVAAHAQSSVTLYGVIDEGVQFNSNAKNVVGGTNVGGRSVSLESASGGLSNNRWGLRGTEDLGSGLKAIFTLESGFNLNTGAFGQGTTPFGRQAFVGLSSVQYGTVTMGRQYDSIVTYVQPVTTIRYFGGSLLIEHPGDLDNFNNSLRTNNTVTYASPDFNGLTMGAQVSLGGQAGNVTAGGGYSAGATYANGPITLGAGYNYFKNPTGAAGTGLFTDNVNGSSILSGVLNSGYATANSYQVAAAGGTYDLGAALIGVSYSNVKYGTISALNGATATFNDVEVGFKWRFTPALFAGLSYNYLKGNSVDFKPGASVGNQHFNEVSLLTDYALSRRTDVYILGAYQRASGTSSTGSAAVADIGNSGDSSNDGQAIVRVGMRHRF